MKEEELKIKFEKFKLNPIETLELLSFQSLAIIEDEDIKIKYIQILLDIQKIKENKKDNAAPKQHCL